MSANPRHAAYYISHGAIAMASALAVIGGAAFAEERNYALIGFNKIDAATGVMVKVNVGGDYSIRAEADAKEFERLMIEVDGDTLSIRRKTGGFGWKSGEVRVDVSMPSIKGIEASSGASVEARNIEAEEIEIDASSGASIIASGTCTALAADASSGASIKAKDLRCKDVEADASSGASISIFASEAIAGDASSGGSINVAGKPAKVSKSTSSGGSVSVGG